MNKYTEDEKINFLIDILSNEYPEPETALNYSTPFQLLIATILSAQTTDKQVNRITKSLFNKYNSLQDFAELNQEELEKEIKSIGLYRNKSKYIINTSQKIIDEYQGEIPKKRKELMKLPGVGRKTANVVLTCAFTRNAFPVDTHVFRVSNRIGIADSQKVNKVEKQLMAVVPENRWGDMHHWLINLGRDVCNSQNPKCEKCKVNFLCNYYLINSKN